MKIVVHNPLYATYGRMIRERFPGVQVAAGNDRESLFREIGDADVLVAWQFPLEALQGARALRWIQLTSAGADHLREAADRLSHVVVTNARGIHGDVMADYAMAAVAMLHWNFPGLFREQQARAWRHRFTGPLADKTLGVIGLGAIGVEIARRGASAGMGIIGVKRVPGPVDGVREVFGPGRLREMLARCDFAVLAVPATPETARMIAEPELRAMKRTAYLINIARGSVVDEPALVRALREGWIAGAALDVFAEEPLPDDSPLWRMENVIVTPHIAGEPAGYDRRVMAIFADNLTRWTAGQPLRNVVDLGRGY